MQTSLERLGKVELCGGLAVKFSLNLLFFFLHHTLYQCCATSRAVPGLIPGGVTWDFFHGSFRQNHVP